MSHLANGYISFISSTKVFIAVSDCGRPPKNHFNLFNFPHITWKKVKFLTLGGL